MPSTLRACFNSSVKTFLIVVAALLFPVVSYVLGYAAGNHNCNLYKTRYQTIADNVAKMAAKNAMMQQRRLQLSEEARFKQMIAQVEYEWTYGRGYWRDKKED